MKLISAHVPSMTCKRTGRGTIRKAQREDDVHLCTEPTENIFWDSVPGGPGDKDKAKVSQVAGKQGCPF